MFKLISKIFLSIILGSLATVLILQNQQDFKKILEFKLQKLTEGMLDCQIDCEIKKINLFSSSIQLGNIQVKDKKNNNWSWHAEQIIVSCSWIDYLLTKKINPTIEIKNLNVYSEIVEGKLAILPHIKKLIFEGQTDLAVQVKDLIISNAKLNINDPDLNLECFINFNAQLKMLNNEYKINFYLNDACISKDKKNYIDKLIGQINILIKSDFQVQLKLDGHCNFPIIDTLNNKCFISGVFNDKDKFLNIKSIDDKLKIDAQACGNQQIDIIVQSPISYVHKILQLNFDPIIEGDCILKIKTDTLGKKIKGSCKIESVNCSFLPAAQIIDTFNFNFKKVKNYWSGDLLLSKNEKFKIKGSWNLNDKNQNINFHAELSCKGQTINTKGTVNLNKSFIQATGNFDVQKFELECFLKPQFILKKLIYYNQDQIECININLQDEKLTGHIIYQAIKNWLPNYVNENISGHGKIVFEGQYENETFIGKLSSQDLNIALLKMQNIIKDINGNLEFNIKRREFIFNNLSMALRKGNLQLTNGKIILNDIFDFKLIDTFCYLPLKLENVFFALKQGVSATVTGMLFLKNNNSAKNMLEGFFNIIDGKIKNNIFSQEFIDDLFGNNILNNNLDSLNLNLSIFNKNLIKVKTPFLSTKVDLDLKVKNTFYNPTVEGFVKLNQGNIYFPYKNLYISDGSLHFLPAQTYDPIINLIAKNKIKKYDISMQVSGTAQNQNIRFESWPNLTNEQILALLLVGSESETINAIMPALLIQNVNDIIFGSSKTHIKVKKYFEKYLTSLKYIKFIPTLTQESGRAGFKGTLEIDVSDKLRASIQKGFTSVEDMRLQVDYSLTDEINIKTIRDERGDLGGEVEMRWKF